MVNNLIDSYTENLGENFRGEKCPVKQSSNKSILVLILKEESARERKMKKSGLCRRGYRE